MGPPSPSQPIVLYDRDCGFCRWALSKLLAWDRRERLRPVALQSPEADRLLGAMPARERMASWHLVDRGGAVHSAGAAFAPLLRELPGGGAAALVAAAVPGPIDRAYRWVAGHRTPIGRRLSAGAKRRADDRIERRIDAPREG